MFSKNIKTLSLFLVLAAVMIVAVGAVSAADGGTATANITTTTGTDVITGSTTDNTASATVGGIIATNQTSSAESTTNQVKSGTPVGSSQSTQSDLTIAFDGNLYNSTANDAGVVTTYTKIDSSAVSNAGVFSTGKITFADGSKLTNGSTYYLKATLGDAYAISGDNYAKVVGTSYYIPLTASMNNMALDKNSSTITVGDDWSFTGTLTGADGKPIFIKDGVTVTITDNAKSNAKIASGTLGTDENGQVTIKNSTWKTLLNNGGNTLTDLDAMTDKNYTITFSYGAATASANLTVNQKNGKINGVLNDTNVDYPADVAINATIVDANGKLLNNTGLTSLNVNIINKATGEKITDLTLSRDEKTGVYTLAKDALKAYAPGVYYITLSSTGNTNYAINNSNTMVLTINKVATSIKGNDTITTTGDYLKGDLDSTFISLISNSTTGLENLKGAWTAVLYKADGTPLNTVTVTSSKDGIATISNNDIYDTTSALSNGNYYVEVTFTPDDTTYGTGYAVSTTTVNLIVKNSNVITVNETTKDFVIGTTGNTTYINVSSPNVENTTVTMFVNNKSVGTIKITNGSAVVDLGKLGLDAGDYNITFVYAGNDTYSASNATCALTVTPEMIGNLTTTNKTIDGVTINSVNKTFTLTLVNGTNASQIINYTGNVQYTIDGKTYYNVTMTEGKVTIDATTLKGLKDGENTVTFKISNNVGSEPVDVVINTVSVPSSIISSNVTTNNATPISIKGTVTNATEGTVVITIFDKEGNPVSSVYANVAADGSFVGSFGTLTNGNYTADLSYESDTGLSDKSEAAINVTVNGTAPTPVVGNITTNLTINSNFTEAYGEGLNLTGKLTDANGNPIVGQHIALNLTNPTTGASKIYWVTTDTNGEYQLQINLFVGSYTASASYGGFTTADNTTTYLPSGPANGTITVTNGTEPVDNRTATVLAFSNFTEKYGQALNFTGTLKTTDGTPIVGQKIGMILSNAAGQSKLYWRTTDSAGEVQLPIELFAGDYTFKCYFEGDSTYQPSNNQEGSITVTA